MENPKHFKEHVILRCLVLFICILLKVAIFGDFANIYQFSIKKGLILGHLHRYNSKRVRENFPEFCT